MTTQALNLVRDLGMAAMGWSNLSRHADQLFMGAAVAVAVVGALTDIVSRRIPNKLTYSAMLLAIVGRTAVQGWHGLGAALGGALIGGGAFLLFYLIQAMGAGDVKLMTAVACLAGTGPAIEIVFASAIAGGIFALLYSLWKGRLRAVLANVVDLIKFHAVMGAEAHPTLNLSNPQAARMPYGIAIAAGVLYSALAFYRRGGI